MNNHTEYHLKSYNQQCVMFNKNMQLYHDNKNPSNIHVFPTTAPPHNINVVPCCGENQPLDKTAWCEMYSTCPSQNSQKDNNGSCNIM